MFYEKTENADKIKVCRIQKFMQECTPVFTEARKKINTRKANYLSYMRKEMSHYVSKTKPSKYSCRIVSQFLPEERKIIDTKKTIDLSFMSTEI